MIVQILLFVFFLAGFSAAETQDPVRENFSQFFNAIAVNDTGEISKQGDILRAEVVKQKETFDAIGRRRGFVLSNKNSSLIKRNDGSLVNDGDPDRFLNDEERGYVSEARDLMNAAGITDAGKRETYLLHLYAKKASALKAAEKKTTKAEKDKEEYEIPLQGVKMRGRMEELANDFWPGGKGKPIGISYFNAMSDILKSPHPKFTEEVAIMEFRKVIEDGEGIENFLTAFKTLYSKLSDLTHVMIAYLHKVELPDYNEFEKIRKLLKNLGIREDKHLVVTISLMLKPAYLLPKREIVPPEEYRCVRLSGGSEDDVRELNLYTNNDQFRMTQQDIRLIFQTTNPQRVEYHYADKTLNFIKVYFENAKMAQQAHYEHNAWWKGIHLITEHVPCNGYKLNGEVKTLILQKTTTTTSMTPIA